MNSLPSLLKLHSPKPIRVIPKSITYGKARSFTYTGQYRITVLPSRSEDWGLERLGDGKMSDDRLAIMAEMENELIKRTASFPFMETNSTQEALLCRRSCVDFMELERPSNPMARLLDDEEVENRH